MGLLTTTTHSDRHQSKSERNSVSPHGKEAKERETPPASTFQSITNPVLRTKPLYPNTTQRSQSSNIVISVLDTFRVLYLVQSTTYLSSIWNANYKVFSV